MAKFEDSMKILMGLEFSSPATALEINPTENGFTYMGIYEEYNKEWEGWDIVKEAIEQYPSLKEASKALYANQELTEKVYDYYFAQFWEPYRLKDLIDQHTADEIYIFGVNAGMKRAVKLAQETVGVEADGIIGNQTINALNTCNFSFFDKAFDDEEIEYYKDLVQRNPAKSIFLDGWINRAKEV